MGHDESKQVTVDGEIVTLTSLTKPLWPKRDLNKADFLSYLTKVAPFMLPFLKDRLLTVIRYPHGATDDSFFQKNCPDYAPDFIQTKTAHDINYIICNDMPTLIWLGNQLAFEYHIPFGTINYERPSEIVFDLDPPSRDDFSLAIKAALMIKEVLDQLKLISFVKTSGNKGLQIYLPLPENQFSYEETRIFTEFIAQYLIEKEPKSFTIERLKKNRHHRLYVDYIQHAEGKTIIAPYSVRGNDDALVATPLYWHEVTPKLRPEQFPLDVIPERLSKVGSPFEDFFKTKAKQPFKPVLDWLLEHKG